MSPASRATLASVHRAQLDEHHALPESARARDLGNERALVRDYSGRVVFELLQNALDRAEEEILLRFVSAADGSGTLLVANDGVPVSVAARPDRPGVPISDFHALLSLHSSAKSAAESVGNKGVGFRAVFATADTVEVWSRADDDEWWGMRLRHPARAAEPVPEGWLDAEVASFYAPELLTGSPEATHERLVTAVVLRGIPADRAKPVLASIRELAKLPLVFLSERARNRERGVRLSLEEGASPPVSSATALDPAQADRHAHIRGLPVSPRLSEVTGLDLTTADVRVLVAAGQGRYWSYLPTEQESGFGVHVHADFYLNNSRRAVAFRCTPSTARPPDDPPEWNAWLLGHAASAIVEDLWTRPAIVNDVDFWRWCTPAACPCPHLRREVTTRLLSSAARFQALVTLAFTPDPAGTRRPWPVRRYRQFFEALEAWAREAYALQADNPTLWAVAREAGGNQLYRWRGLLRKLASNSRAPVLPIIDAAGEDGDGLVHTAVAIPTKTLGARIFLRRATGFRLPDALVRQELLVTVFSPPFAESPADFGQLDFGRPELLASMRPGESEQEHRELLAAALQLATEEAVRGGRGSVFVRGPFTARTSWWRWVLPDQKLTDAGHSLAALSVPTLRHGWRPAREVVVPNTWPEAPQLDEETLRAVLETIDPECRPDLESATSILGIGAVPLLGDASGPILPPLPSVESPEALGAVAASILLQWARGMGPLVAHERCAALRAQLVDAAWVPAEIAESIAGATLHHGLVAARAYRPFDLWFQRAQHGFHTTLLPRLVSSREPPDWASALAIVSIGVRDDRKSLAALHWLHAHTARPEAEWLPDLERTTTRLTEALADGDLATETTPVLVRQIDERGRVGETMWRTGTAAVWHDSGEHSHVLTAFTNYRLWVVRRGLKRLAGRLGLAEFQPGSPRVQRHGVASEARRAELEAALERALPDVVAVAARALIHPPFDPEGSLRVLATVAVEHVEDVWLEYRFGGAVGSLGRGEGGDVFAVPATESAAPTLLFDGVDGPVPLVACARPLAELLDANRQLIPFFTAALAAWTSTAAGAAMPASVLRFRRDHAISESEVAVWAERLAALRLPPDQREDWRSRVSGALARFGQVNEAAVAPGRCVTRGTWSVVDAPLGTDEDGVTEALRLALGGGPGPVVNLLPRVDFVHENARRFRDFDRTPLVAARAQLAGRGAWRESFYVELKELAAREPSADEVRAFRLLAYSATQAWRHRFELTGAGQSQLIDLDPAAVAFARGQIPLSAPPRAEVPPEALSAWSSAASTSPIEALNEEQWLNRSRKKAAGGGRAEDAVLQLALREAQAWLSRDEPGFWAAIELALAPVVDSPSVMARLAAARGDATDDSLAPLLRVSTVVGNAGFDLLVPDRAGGVVLQVEVKRVGDIEEPMFVLSENERRQALRLGEAWRLWLIAGDGSSRDVTWIRDRFASHQVPVEQLLAGGLRPGEWWLKA